jgi:hypothetical protein
LAAIGAALLSDKIKAFLGVFALAVIPYKINRTYGKHLHKERRLIECLIGRIKHFDALPRVTTKPSTRLPA